MLFPSIEYFYDPLKFSILQVNFDAKTEYDMIENQQNSTGHVYKVEYRQGNELLL